MGRSVLSDSVGLDSDSMVGSAVLGVTDGVGLAVSEALEESDGVGLAVSAVADGEGLPDCGVVSFGLPAPA